MVILNAVENKEIYHVFSVSKRNLESSSFEKIIKEANDKKMFD